MPVANFTPSVSSSGTSAVYLAGTAGTIGVRVGQIDDTVRVQFDPGHTLGKVEPGVGTFQVFFPDTSHTLGYVEGINKSIAIHLLSTNGTLAVNVQRINETVAVYLQNTAGTIRVGDIPGSMGVYFSPSLPTIKGINDSIAVHLLSTNGTISVNVQRINETVAVYLQNTAGTIGVRVGQVDGTVAVYFSQSKPVVLADEQGTASIFTVSGSTSGVSVSGVTLVAPSANYSFKVYAYSLQTTGIVSLVAKFTNGAGTGPTEFWRPLVTANQTNSTPIGANLSTGGGGKPLFATGVSTTLALVLDTATLVHYSVAYTKESS